MKKLFWNENAEALEKNDNIILSEPNEAEVNETSLTVIIDEKKWWLQSDEDMQEAVNVWCEQFENVSYLTSFVIFGFGSCEYVRSLHRKYPENQIIIYEPYEIIIAKQMLVKDMTDIFNEPKVKIAAGESRRQLLEKWFRSYISYGGIDNMQFAILPNYNKMFEEEYSNYLKQIQEMVEYEIMMRNTVVIREECRAKNFLYNLEKFWNEAGLIEIRDTLKEIDKDRYAAVLIAAGPSLDKNIRLLSKYKNKVFIVCVDAALRVALKNNIRPDLIITQDPEFKDPTIFDNQYAEQVPVIVSMTSDYRMVEKSKGRKFYTYEGEDYVDDITRETSGELYGLDSGGSVANTAFSFLFQVAGFKKIILIGQDLGYPENRLHAKDVFYDEKTIDEKDKDDYFYVEDIYGGKVLTENNMNMYRLWYEKILIDHPDLNVIDATEGGALIHGTEIRKLQESLSAYNYVEQYNFEEQINNAKYLFNKEERKIIKCAIEESYDSLASIKHKLIQQEKIYDKLDLLNRKGKYGTGEFKKCIKEIGEFHQWAQNDRNMDLIHIYTNREEYATLDEMQSEISNTYDEIKLVVSSGKKLLKAYIEGVEKLRDEWSKMRGYTIK